MTSSPESVHGIRPWLLLYLVLSLVFSILLWGFSQYRYALYKDEILESYARQEAQMVRGGLEEIQNEWSHIWRDLYGDVLGNPLTIAFLMDDPQRQEMASRHFFNFLQGHGIYHKFRLVDTGGQEVFKVVNHKGRVHIATPGELEDKSTRYYFQNTLPMNKGEIYISPFDLNVEHGLVEQPHRPTIRFGSPLFSEKGEKVGIVLLSLSGHKILRRLRSVLNEGVGRTSLVNADGYWLMHPEHRHEFGFNTGDDFTYAKRFPAAWPLISNSDHGRLMTRDGLFVYAEFHPLLDNRESHYLNGGNHGEGVGHADHGVAQSEFSAISMGFRNYHWKIISHTPASELQRMYRIKRDGLFLVVGTVNIIGLLLIGLMIFLVAHPRIKARKERLETERQLVLNNLHLGQNPDWSLTEKLDRFLFDLFSISWLNERGRGVIYLFSNPFGGDSQARGSLVPVASHNMPEGVILAGSLEPCVVGLSMDSQETRFCPCGEEERAGRRGRLCQAIKGAGGGYAVLATISGVLEGVLWIMPGWTERLADHESFLNHVGHALAEIIYRHRSEELLKKLSRAVDQSASSIVITDAAGNIEYVNQKFTKVTGYSKQEAMGQNPRILRSNQTPLEVYRGLWSTILAGRDWHGELLNKRKDGTLFWENAIISPIRDGRGITTHYLAVKEDITERKRTQEEQRQLERQLRQAQKMESIGHLTGGIAHDFNNILAAIVGYSELALVRFIDDEESKLAKYLKAIHQAGERARDLIAQMLAFSRSQETQAKDLAVAPVVKEVVKMMRATLPTTISIAIHMDADLPSIHIDPVQLHQILMNLFINARDAMEGKGAISVSATLAQEKIVRPCASCHNDFCLDNLVELSVSDQGPGINMELLNKIFEPFFTTKEVGKGTGMGLSVVHGNLHAHRGHLLVDSKPGEGTTFRLFFPPVAQSRQEEVVLPGLASAGGGMRGRVLVVDDEKAITEFMTDLLEGVGFSVVTTTRSREALSWFVEDPHRFDAVITDQTMPEMTGVEMAQGMLAARPDLPVILCTGYSPVVDADKAVAMGFSAFFHKPVEGMRLVEALARLLPEESPATSGDLS